MARLCEVLPNFDVFSDILARKAAMFGIMVQFKEKHFENVMPPAP